MPAEHTLTGNVGVGKDQMGNDVIVIQTGPADTYVIPLPDDLPPGAPPEAKTAKQLVKDHLNSGIQVAGARDLPIPGHVVMG